MAKQQTFGDKVKKKKGDNKIHVKVICSSKTDDGRVRFHERFVAIDDMNQLEKVEVNI